MKDASFTYRTERMDEALSAAAAMAYQDGKTYYAVEAGDEHDPEYGVMDATTYRYQRNRVGVRRLCTCRG